MERDIPHHLKALNVKIEEARTAFENTENKIITEIHSLFRKNFPKGTILHGIVFMAL